MTKRIVITGMGWVTPLGYDIETVWRRMLAGESGIGPISHFDASTFPTTFAAQVRDYDVRQFVQYPELHEGAGLNTQFALGAAAQAWKAAGLDAYSESGDFDHERLGIYLGSGEGSLDFDNYVASNLAGWDAARQQVDAARWAPAAIERMTMLREIEQEPHMPLTHLAMEFEALGPAFNCLTACAASTQAIGEAMCILQRGDADVMITGGTHSMIHPLGVTGFNRLTALSNRNPPEYDPRAASRPFSADRDGFVLGEGAGVIVIETLEHAQKRGLPPERILAEIAGYGSTADAYRITDIQPDGRGAEQAMRQAIDAAGLTPEQVDYISAHGTGTKENDSIETKAIKAVFENSRSQISNSRSQISTATSRVPPVSSIKSMIGHLIAAAGAVEAIVCVLALRDQKLPPTMNLTNPDPECNLDYVPNAAREAEADHPIEVCLSNSFGFGGQNDTLIIRRMGV